MSTIKVDTIATRTGSGNITFSNNVASLTSAGAISGTNLSASGTLAVTGNTTVGGTLVNTGLITASAGVAIGGTGAANTLDDYEEGTFTATCGNSVTLKSTNDLLSYTKIGRMVHVYGGISVNDSNSGADFNIQNLPFTCANTSEQSFQNVGITRPYLWNVASDCIQLICFAANGTTVLYFTEIKDNAAETATNADANSYMNFSIWYEAA